MAGIDVASLFSLSGKVALVTGGSRGIGRMMAEGLVRAGAAVYVSSRRKDACERTAAELSEHGPRRAAPADVATPDGRAALVETLGARESRLHVLINNAGATWGAPYAEYPAAAFDKVQIRGERSQAVQRGGMPGQRPEQAGGPLRSDPERFDAAPDLRGPAAGSAGSRGAIRGGGRSCAAAPAARTSEAPAAGASEAPLTFHGAAPVLRGVAAGPPSIGKRLA